MKSCRPFNFIRTSFLDPFLNKILKPSLIKLKNIISAGNNFNIISAQEAILFNQKQYITNISPICRSSVCSVHNNAELFTAQKDLLECEISGNKLRKRAARQK